MELSLVYGWGWGRVTREGRGRRVVGGRVGSKGRDSRDRRTLYELELGVVQKQQRLVKSQSFATSPRSGECDAIAASRFELFVPTSLDSDLEAPKSPGAWIILAVIHAVCLLHRCVTYPCRFERMILDKEHV